MILTYLPEHADSARVALDLAERESTYLRYTCNTLYAEAIDLAWGGWKMRKDLSAHGNSAIFLCTNA